MAINKGKRAIKKSESSKSGLAPRRARLARQSERDLFEEVRLTEREKQYLADLALPDDMPAARARRRYDQCDGTCTVDCGHCKGQGPPR